MTNDLEDSLKDTLQAEANAVRDFPAQVARGIQDRLGSRTAPIFSAMAVAVPLLVLAFLGYTAYQLSQGRTPPGPLVGPASHSTPTASTATPMPTPTPTLPVGPPFQCSATSSGGDAATVGQLAAVRTAAQAGFDRITFEFSSPDAPGYRLSSQAGTQFTRDASGMPVTLAGAFGMRIVFPTSTGQGSYSGSTDLKTGLSVLKEAVELGDFERVLSWGLGIDNRPCYRVLELRSPARLVIDLAPINAGSPNP